MPYSRRDFLKQSGIALGATQALLSAQTPTAAAPKSPNDQLNIAWIGTGSRGDYQIQRTFAAKVGGLRVVALCDAYEGNLARAKDRIQTLAGNTPKTYADYHDLLADPSIDIVFIATPEHLHYPMFMAAMKAGKHVYIEKPFAHTIEEGAEMVKAAQRAGKVVQVGTQNRSNSLYIKAKDMVAKGMIGDVHYVRAFWYRNSLDDNPAWRYKIPPEANESNTDWKRFLEGAPKRLFDPHRFFQWRLYWDYSGGISTDLLVHQTDITHFVCGRVVPTSCAASGGTYRWFNDDRDVPDTLSALYEYDDRFHINYSCYLGNDHFGYGEQFMGNEGTIEVLNRQTLNFYPEKFGGKPPDKVAAREPEMEDLPGYDNKAVEAHIANFIDAVRGRGSVIAPPEVGQQAAVSGHMATLSFRNNKKVYWDDKKSKLRFA